MKRAFRGLASYWATFPSQVGHAPFIHRKDLEYLDASGYWNEHPDAEKKLNLKRYLHSPRFGMRNDPGFHFSLLPSPFIGDLANAEIFVLLLNPGFAHLDYYAEYAQPKYRRRLEQTLQQDFRGTNFPFLHLDPTFLWTGGFQWWERKLRDLLRELADKRFKGSYYRALEFAGRRLASIELVPYHSSGFKERSFVEQLPSAQVARRAVHQLRQQTRKVDLAIVVTRQTSAWGLGEVSGKIVCYKTSAEARGASLSRKSRGGQLILNKLLER